MDPDPNKQGNLINSIKVYSNGNIIETLKLMPVQEIVIAILDSSAEHKAELYNLYKRNGLKVKIQNL